MVKDECETIAGQFPVPGGLSDIDKLGCTDLGEHHAGTEPQSRVAALTRQTTGGAHRDREEATRAGRRLVCDSVFDRLRSGETGASPRESLAATSSHGCDAARSLNVPSVSTLPLWTRPGPHPPGRSSCLSASGFSSSCLFDGWYPAITVNRSLLSSSSTQIHLSLSLHINTFAFSPAIFVFRFWLYFLSHQALPGSIVHLCILTHLNIIQSFLSAS